MGIGTRIPIGFAVPQTFLDGRVDMPLVRRVVDRAEALGFDSLWAMDGTFRDTACLEPISFLGYLAAVSQRAKIGVSVLVFPLYSPAQLARAFATIDQMSGGRLIIGLGIGGRSDLPAFYDAVGIPYGRRPRRLVDGLGAMRALWTQPEAQYTSETIRLDGIPMEPKPFQRPHLPVWFGGHVPDALRRAVRHSDGWMGAGYSSNDEFKKSVPVLRQAIAEMGRDPSTFTISKRVYIAVDKDAARLEPRVREWFTKVYKDPAAADRVAVFGTPASCAKQLEGLIEAGAQHLVLHPVLDSLGQLEALAEMVGPLRPARTG